MYKKYTTDWFMNKNWVDIFIARIDLCVTMWPISQKILQEKNISTLQWRGLEGNMRIVVVCPLDGAMRLGFQLSWLSTNQPSKHCQVREGKLKKRRKAVQYTFKIKLYYWLRCGFVLRTKPQMYCICCSLVTCITFNYLSAALHKPLCWMWFTLIYSCRHVTSHSWVIYWNTEIDHTEEWSTVFFSQAYCKCRL